MSQSGRSLLAFLTGCLTGAAIGVVYAPEKGEVTRDKLTYRLSKYKEELERVIESLMDGKNASTSSARSKGEKVVTEAREKAERLLEDVDRLMDQIKNQGA